MVERTGNIGEPCGVPTMKSKGRTSSIEPQSDRAIL